MLTLRVLRRKCNAVTEIGFFLFIFEISQAIAIVEHETKLGRIFTGAYAWNSIIDDLEAAKNEKESAIVKLTRFGLTNPIRLPNLYLPYCYSPEFYRWFKWWEDYFYSLNDVELVDLEKSRLNGLDLSEWYPTGSWKRS